MGRRFWFPDDIANLLTALHDTAQAMDGDPEYQRGFLDALRAVAVAFGVECPRGTEPRVIECGALSTRLDGNP